MNSSQCSHSQSSNWKLKVILASLGVLLLVMGFYLEKLCFKIVNFVCYFDFLSIFVIILLHLLLARRVVLIFLFPGSNFFVKRIIRYEHGKIQALQFSRVLNTFKTNLEMLLTTSNGNLNQSAIYNIRTNLKNVREILTYCSTVYKKIKEQYTTSDYQQKFSLSLTVLEDNLNDSELVDIIEEACKSYERLGSAEDIRNINLDRHLKKILNNVDVVDDHLNEFLLKKNWSTNLKNFWANDIFGSMQQFRAEMSIKFNTEEYHIESDDGKDIDIVLLKCDKKKKDSNSNNMNSNDLWNHKSISEEKKKVVRNLMIICGPNGAAFEQFSRNLRLEDLYTRNNVDVMVWNYQGYGITDGSPCFKNVKKDAESVVNFARKQNRWELIGVHGISIGGLAACHVAGKNLVDFCIADRTFSSVDDIVLTFPFGSVLNYLYKSLLLSESNNVDNFLNCKSPKIILADPSDTIVKDSSSLKTGIARNVVSDIAKFNKECVIDTKNEINSILDVILTETESEQLYDSLIRVFTFIINSENDRINLNKRKKQSEEKNLLLQTSQGKNEGSRNIKYSNIKDNKVNSEFELTTSFESGENLVKNRKLMKEIFSMFSRFEAAGDTLERLKKIYVANKSKARAILFIKNFFTNMFVWGSIKNEDEDFSDDKVMSHKEVVLRFKEFDLAIREVMRRVKEPSDTSLLDIFKTLEIILEIFNKINNSFHKTVLNNASLKSTLNSSDSASTNTAEHPLSNALSTENIVNTVTPNTQQSSAIELSNSLPSIGNLIPLSCGHNGNFSETELHLIRYELIKAKFL